MIQDQVAKSSPPELEPWSAYRSRRNLCLPPKKPHQSFAGILAKCHGRIPKSIPFRAVSPEMQREWMGIEPTRGRAYDPSSARRPDRTGTGERTTDDLPMRGRFLLSMTVCDHWRSLRYRRSSTSDTLFQSMSGLPICEPSGNGCVGTPLPRSAKAACARGGWITTAQTWTHPHPTPLGHRSGEFRRFARREVLPAEYSAVGPEFDVGPPESWGGRFHDVR